MKYNEVMGEEKGLCMDAFTGTTEENLLNSLSLTKKAYLIKEKLKYTLFQKGSMSVSQNRLQVYYKSKYARELDQFATSEDKEVDPDIHMAVLDNDYPLGLVCVVAYMTNSENGHVELSSKSHNRLTNLPHEDFEIERKFNPPTMTQTKAFLEVQEKANKALDSIGFEFIKPFEETNDENKWQEYFGKVYNTVWHPVATCKMGNDENAVVDASLKVRGVDNLRVVDNSVIPCVNHGNTMLPALHVGQKASEIIRAQYKNKIKMSDSNIIQKDSENEKKYLNINEPKITAKL